MAALPAALPVTPLWLGQPASSTANLAWPSRLPIHSLLCPANDHAASSTGHHPSSEKAAANYRAYCPRQKPGQESQPPSTPHPLALVLWSPPLPSRVMKDTAEVGARKPPPLTGGKTGPQQGADSPKSQSQPVRARGPECLARGSFRGPMLASPSMALPWL